jgi:proteasome lid subunit RPN8/RPN11
MNRLPVDRSVVGVVHSHPSKSARPSKEDLQLFGKHGHTHIIIHHPYTETTWRTWNHRGEPVHLDVV